MNRYPPTDISFHGEILTPAQVEDRLTEAAGRAAVLALRDINGGADLYDGLNGDRFRIGVNIDISFNWIRLETLRCDECGRVLNPPDCAQFVRCLHCFELEVRAGRVSEIP
jgi:phage FluMu protein Com